MNLLYTALIIFLFGFFMTISTGFNLFIGKSYVNGLMGSKWEAWIDFSKIYDPNNLTDCERSYLVFDGANQLIWWWKTLSGKCYKSGSNDEIFFINSLDDYPWIKPIDQSGNGNQWTTNPWPVLTWDEYYKIERDCFKCAYQKFNARWLIDLNGEVFPNLLQKKEVNEDDNDF